MGRRFRVGTWEVLPLRNEIVGPAGAVKLEPRVMRLLVCLSNRPGEIVSREELTETLWSGDFVSDEVLTQTVSELRKSLADDPKQPRFVQTVPKQGYRLVAEVDGGDRDRDVEETTTRHEPTRARGWRWALALGAVVGAAVAAVWWVVWRPAPKPPTVRLTISIPEGATSFHAQTAISPDGRRVAFTAATASGGELYVRDLDRLEPRVLASDLRLSPFGPYLGTWLAFSPDGDRVAYVADNTLWIVSVEGGASVPVHEAVDIQGIAWSAADHIVYGLGVLPSALMRVPASGGTEETLIASTAKEFYHFPHVLPGSRVVLFAVGSSLLDSSVGALDLETGEITILTDGSVPKYIAGHLLFSRAGTLFAQPFDPDRIELTGAPVPLLDRTQIFFRGPTNEAAFTVSDTGTLVYAPPLERPEQRLLLVDLESNAETVLDLPPEFPRRSLRFSPDGSRLVADDLSDIWIYDLEQETTSVLRSDDSIDYRPIWKDDEHVVFVSNRETGADIFIQRADGTEPAVRIADEVSVVPMTFSPDGRTLLYMAQGSGLWDIWSLQMDGDGNGAARPFLNESYFEVTPDFSPDGKWVAYGSDETGAFEVYVRRFPDGSGKTTISRGGGSHPVWSPDGERLYYRTVDSLVAVPIRSTDPEVIVGEPMPLPITGDFGPMGGGRIYDLHPDGARLLMFEKPSGPPPQRTHLVVVQHGFEELSGMLPTR